MAKKSKNIKPKKRRTIREYEDALYLSAGSMAKAAKQLGVSKSAVTQRVKKSRRLQKAIKEAKAHFEEGLVSLARDKLETAIKANNWRAIRYVLDRYDGPETKDLDEDVEVTWVEPKDLEEARPLTSDLDDLDLGGCQADDLGLNGNNGKSKPKEGTHATDP